MDKKEFIEANNSILKKLNQLIVKIENLDIHLENYNDNWSVKDVLGHLVWYEEEIVKLLTTRSMDMADEIWNNPLNIRNSKIYELMKNKKWEELRSRHKNATNKLNLLFEELPATAFQDPEKFENMPKEWVPWKIFAGSTLWHYKDHFKSLSNLVKKA